MLDILPGHNLGIVRADPGQIEQILINLCVNARDAMPESGKITIETENVRIDEEFCESHAWAEPGRYALLSVTDTGCGMDEKTRGQVFEPFFTTKDVGKGIAPAPLALEPPYHPIASPRENDVAYVMESPPKMEEIARFRVWIAPTQKFEWQRSELFLKHLQGVGRRIGWEVYGNKERIRITLFCYRQDIAMAQAAFRGQFQNCALTRIEEEAWDFGLPSQEAWNEAQFVDYFPLPPYSETFTQPEELYITPYESIIANLLEIPSPGFGFCQVLFQPVDIDNNWRRNVEMLRDLSFSAQLNGNPLASRYAREEPSYALQQETRELEAKAHNDKPFYAASVRTGVVGVRSDDDRILQSLLTMGHSFLHGGQRLRSLTQNDYAQAVSPQAFRDMFLLGLTYRPGFLLNSLELSGFVHVPPAKIFEERESQIEPLETLSVKNERLYEGCQIGTSSYAGVPHPVCIPYEYRVKSVHCVGRPGTGKSTMLENNIMQDVLEGNGLVLLDPHGDLVERILRLVPEGHIERTIYFNPADPEYVPLWNPLRNPGINDPGRIADDMVAAIRSVVEGWGDRLENLLRFAFLGLIGLPDATLQDVYDLLRRGSASDKIRDRILANEPNENVKKFLSEDLRTYTKADLHPPQHKLSKLLASGTYGEMLSQPESRIDFQKIMEEKQVLLVDLSGLGRDVANILGCFMLSVLHLTALGRHAIPEEEREPFHVYCDEAHRFTTDSLEHMIAETRKYGVGITLAHQFMSQFSAKKRDALGSVGSSVVFNVPATDSNYLRKELQQKVSATDVISLNEYEAFARIGNDVVRIKSLPPRPVPENHFRERIIRESHNRYYRPLQEVRAIKQRMGESKNRLFKPSMEVIGDEAYFDEIPLSRKSNPGD